MMCVTLTVRQWELEKDKKEKSVKSRVFYNQLCSLETRENLFFDEKFRFDIVVLCPNQEFRYLALEYG